MKKSAKTQEIGPKIEFPVLSSSLLSKTRRSTRLMSFPRQELLQPPPRLHPTILKGVAGNALRAAQARVGILSQTFRHSRVANLQANRDFGN
jgi:hypothetical protein